MTVCVGGPMDEPRYTHVHAATHSSACMSTCMWVGMGVLCLCGCGVGRESPDPSDAQSPGHASRLRG